jgi:hypothetical protein
VDNRSVSDLVAELEQQARARFVRWDPALWRDLIQGPAAELLEALQAAGLPGSHCEALIESYLRLGAEGIGLGYLVPASSGAASFLTLAWTRLVPKGLAAVPAARQAQTLADCWNLGENLEASPLWLKRIFLRLCAETTTLGSLEALVADVAGRALEEPKERLGPRPRLVWVHLAQEDHRFLPGTLHFVAPTVVCVHDRHRAAAGGRDAATQGAWLTDPPLLLGPMGCAETPGNETPESFERLLDLSRRDPRAADWFAMAANDWRAGVTLETSQFLVALLPA